MNNAIISVENLNKIYPIYVHKKDRMKEALSLTRKKYHKDFYALNNISFDIQRGETIGIIGQNGSGKSTLLKILTGVLSPTSGSVQVHGKVSALLELGAGFNPEMTGMENIYLNGTIMGYTKTEMDERVPKIVEFADIGDFVQQPVKMYSSGMFARLAFAVAINVEPEILIVDEALSVGDMRFQIKCMDHMNKMMMGGTTVLFVSHDTNAIRRFCTRAIWLNQGEIKSAGNVDRVADEYISFLKIGEYSQEIVQEVIVQENEKPFEPNGGIAEIVDVIISTVSSRNIDNCTVDDKLILEIVYDVYEEDFENPVLGVAIRSIDGDYVCGLNTLLDRVQVPWKYGRNRFTLEYTYGILVISGKYELDVAIFDKTATVPVQYLAAFKKISVVSPYIGEGLLIIPHHWKAIEP